MRKSLFEQILSQRRLVLTLAAILALTGAVMWMTMVRQEDPRLPDFWGQVLAPYPGADAETVERLVLEPIEDALAEVNEIAIVQATAYSGMAVMTIELYGSTEDVDKAWDEVRDALERARRDFPKGVPAPMLDSDQQDQDAIVLAVTGSGNALELYDAARRIKKQLLRLHPVSRVHFIAAPVEQVTIELNDAASGRLGITPAGLAARLDARNRILPGGSIALDGETVSLRPMSEFASVEELASTSVSLRNGSAIPLSEIARVRLGPAEPEAARMRHNGEMSVGVAVVPRKAINLVDFGEEVRAMLERVRPEYSPLQIREVTFQPKRTAARLAELNLSLFLGILIVGGVLVTFMGIRLGMMVAFIVPLVTMASVAVYALGGGVLHQISIAALVISLGILVDNAIVISENVQWRMDRGISAGRAGVEAVRELAAPLAGATATTLVAFVPMLISKGPTAEFTRSIPVVIMLTLAVSYVFAVFVTPNLARMVLRPAKREAGSLVGAAGGAMARFSVRHPFLVLAVTVLVVSATVVMAGGVKRQFFPLSDRNQLLVDIKLKEGAHLDSTDAVCRKLESALQQRPNIRSVSSFIGRSAPHFYYNVSRVPFSPHFAQLIVETRLKENVDEELELIRSFMSEQAPNVELVARKLEQGPPVNAPVEIRLFGDRLDDLSRGAGKIADLLRRIPGTRDVRHDLGPGAPVIRFHIDDAVAGRHGVSRAQVAGALYGHTRGLQVGELYIGEDPVDVVIRSSAGENTPVSVLENIKVGNAAGQSVPLSQVARLETRWRPAAIRHYNASRVATVSGQLAEGVAFSQVLAQLIPMLEKADLPPSVRVGIGGEAEGAGQANAALMKSLPIGVLLLFGVLLVEFNSFRRLGIILMTVPLAAVGVVPGLLIAGQPFGFMSMLGVIALVGIVVNNAIVLIELIDAQRKEGMTLAEAIETGVRRRIRPILLTSATTVAGLLPLGFSSSTLWPPLASAMISGLVASTLLTLAVVPALYRVLFARKLAQNKKMSASLAATAASAFFLAVLIFPQNAASAGFVDLRRAMESGRQRPLGKAAACEAMAAESRAVATGNLARWPTITGAATALVRNRQMDLQTPFGPFPSMAKDEQTVGIRVNQPIFDASRQLYRIPAASADAEAARHESRRIRQQLAAGAAAAYLNVLSIEEQMAATEAFIRSIRARAREMQARVDSGRALEADGLKIQLVYEQGRQDLRALQNARKTAGVELARAMGAEDVPAPMPAANFVNKPFPDRDGLLSRSLNARYDLKQKGRELAAIRYRIAAIRAENLPRVEAGASFFWVNDSPYQTDNWMEGSIQLTWTPFAANTRKPRTAALLAGEKALSLQIRELRREIETEILEALSDLSTVYGRYEVEIRGIAQAKETLRVERKRHLEGRATTNDLLAAEASLRERTTRRDLARLEAAGVWVRLWLAVGEDDLWFLAEDKS